MGCDGCELWKPTAAIATILVAMLVLLTRKPKATVKQVVAQAVGARKTSELYRDREHVTEELAANLSLTRDQKKEVVDLVREECKCYAGLLGTFRAGHAGYADEFELPKLYPGRVENAARWDLPDAKEIVDKPWLAGAVRLVFLSDMGDALSADVPFDYLRDEIVTNVNSPNGRRHIWLWLTKRPEKMAEFAGWLHDRRISWPQNLVPMTTLTMQRYAGRVDQLRRVPSQLRGLSLEPLFEPIDLDLRDIAWVIVGGGSDVLAQPFYVEWALALKRKCAEEGVKFFFKQAGKHPFYEGKPLDLEDKHGGDWAEWPEEWRVREIPEGFRVPES